MRYVIIALSIAGIVVSGLALGAHYGPRADPLDLLRSHWNSAYVNQSPYAEVHGIPVAVLGIAGYGLLCMLALMGKKGLMVWFSGAGLAYGLYLTNIEAHILHIWCVYCVSSLIFTGLIAIMAFAWLLFDPAGSPQGRQTA
jgi:vitamin-K-epoxide reductase (warfarin-sensitive)